MSAVFRLLRPKQWTKNLLVLAAYIFTQGWQDPTKLAPTLWAVLAFCLVSSGVYVLNDLADRKRDQSHPQKKSRPIASGAISVTSAGAWMVLCWASGFAAATAARPEVVAVLAVYVAVQLAYSFALKAVPILDVFIIGSGFILRAAAGAAAIAVTMSPWLLYCTGSLALLLGFAKRRHELGLSTNAGLESRPALRGYSGPVIDALILLSAGLAAISYGVYSIESATARAHPALVATGPVVLYGICRYLYWVFGQSEGGEPESLLLQDPHLWMTVALFIVLAVAATSGWRLPLVMP